MYDKQVAIYTGYYGVFGLLILLTILSPLVTWAIYRGVNYVMAKCLHQSLLLGIMYYAIVAVLMAISVELCQIGIALIRTWSHVDLSHACFIMPIK